MKIVKLALQNFRTYSSITVNFDEKLNIIIGKNDIGKSTILEALEIFFNNETVKIDANDLCVRADESTISIQVSFSLKNEEYIIDTIPTNLREEFLLDNDNYLTIKKTWDCSSQKLTSKTYIVAYYPTVFQSPLPTLKIGELKNLLDKYSDKLDVNEVKKNQSSAIRKAIYQAENPQDLNIQEIPIDKEDGKKIWETLRKELPLFFLFQSDRANKDSDKEVQNPLKAITKTAISKLEEELEEVKEKIRIEAEQLGQKTLEKLQEMNPDIADVLTPQMSHKSWDSLFSFSFNCDDGIPINKRGSGVRRLILLNYFRAEAERQSSDSRNVIYAIEEPETSQHPNWQIQLFDALVDLSEHQETQVLITTHSPSLARRAEQRSLIFLNYIDQKVVVQCGDNVCQEEIVETLGILPTISSDSLDVKVILCLEGPTDREFFIHIGKLFDLDLENDHRILVISLGGSTLGDWVNKNYLAKLNKPEIHIYDRDVPKYQDTVDKVNNRENNSWATLTNVREIENYIHPVLVKEIYPIEEDFIDFIDVSSDWVDDWKNKDIPKDLSVFLKRLKENGNRDIRNESQEKIKGKFSREAAPRMTIELLQELQVYEEVNGWFEKVKQYINHELG